MVHSMLHFPRFTSEDLDTLYGLNGIHASAQAMDVFEVMGTDGYPRKFIIKNSKGYGCYCPDGKPLLLGRSQLAEVI